MNSDELVVPGQRITTVKGTPGTGVFTLPDGNLYASLVGKVTKDQVTGQVTVTPFPQNAHRSVVPQVDQIILGKVTKITPKYAAVDISAIEDVANPTASLALPEAFRGTIRIQDIYPEDQKETPQVATAFRPGDLVRASIIGIGDASTGFLLSTATSPRHGVVFARCAASGQALVPVAWNLMVCSQTGLKEPRKAARPE